MDLAASLETRIALVMQKHAKSVSLSIQLRGPVLTGYAG